MNSTYNRQFIQFDFTLLDDPRFITFVGKSEFAVYLILRRYIWRGRGNINNHLHQLLFTLYDQHRLLCCSLSNAKIAAKVGLKGENSVTKLLARLEKAGVIRRKRTGRQTIFVLGEWIDISENKSGIRRLEWFYLDQKFGVDESVLPESAPVSPDSSSIPKGQTDQSKMDGSDQSSGIDQSKTDRSAPSKMDRSYKNREGNINVNVTNVNGSQAVADFPDQPSEMHSNPASKTGFSTTVAGDKVKIALEATAQRIEQIRDNQASDQGEGVPPHQTPSPTGFQAVKALPDLELDPGEVEANAQWLAEEFDDLKSLNTFRIISQKFPRLKLGEIRSDIKQEKEARSEVKVFMAAIGKLAEKQHYKLAKRDQGPSP